MQEGQNMRLVLALLSPADVIHDHVSGFLNVMPSLQKVLGGGRSGNFRQMFMLRNCENLFLGEAA
jgi:hypothetical protein